MIIDTEVVLVQFVIVTVLIQILVGDADRRVRMLVKKHEVGGDEDQDLLCDADCLAYMEEKAVRLAKNYKKLGKTDYDNPDLYHLVLNMSRVSLDKALELIVNLVT